MPSLCSILARRVLVLALTSLAVASHTQTAAQDTSYPGTIALHVDATDLDRRIFRVRETLPVAMPGPLRLYYPRWLPGNHGPTGRITALDGLKISAAGRAIAWKRDPLDVHASRWTCRPAWTRWTSSPSISRQSNPTAAASS